jgi:amino acid adenylation domain-containing protein
LPETILKLHQYFDAAFRNNPDKIFIQSSSGTFTFRQLQELAGEFGTLLKIHNLSAGERVVIYSSKNAESIAMMIACNRNNLLYVPVSSLNPPSRAEYILNDTSAGLLLCDNKTAAHFEGKGFQKVYSKNQTTAFLAEPESTGFMEGSNAFILFTSGSTGNPKGVVIPDHAATAFIDWSAGEFNIRQDDRIASIAPFNFDLSVFDIYVAAKSCASLILYTEDETRNALLMAQKISDDAITVIYSTPTFFTTLASYGKLSRYDYSALHTVLFAGEIFYPANFLLLKSYWADKTYANLYGPTETNVCTFYRVNPDNPVSETFPVGKPCNYAQALLQDEEGKIIRQANHPGELLVGGQSLFSFYWNDVKKTNESFTQINGNRFYKTGDLAYIDENNDYVYAGRKDRMVKKNGFRIEPAEIEKSVLKLKDVTNCAVIFKPVINQLICFI